MMGPGGTTTALWCRWNGRRARRRAGEGGHGGGGGPPDGGGLVTAAMLAATFPDWRLFRAGGAHRAHRDGPQEQDGPRSLLRRDLAAPDLTALAEKLCVQAWLDSLTADELAAVWRDARLPALTGAPA